MAKYAGVWGIDIGQCAFKALRCKLDGDHVVADAFDYIEYPKILSQPEAEPGKMIQDALDQFLSRNEVKGYRIALAVPGQSGLAKFFKPPPVEAKKIPEIVKFEARQQIPFALEDVCWDFQQMGGGEVDGFAMETEVGLFAMKREQVYRAMKPFQGVGLELDIIQLAPLSIYNFVTHDVLGDKIDAEQYDPDNPPPSLVVLSMGTDTTDLVITNGFRVWQRSIPLGGNHFTKQLTKELKLTFAKAEHLKRNARQAENPKLVFQAMRPVFNDLVTEVQRSIGYFQGIDRKAKIGKVVVLGNAVKLPGLQQYLAKSLGYDVSNFDAFSKLSGPSVLTAPAFRDNQLSFGVSYGLCLQGLNVSKLRTNLVPREIVTERVVRAKKPWAVATVAALLLGGTFYVFFQYGRLHQVAEDREVAGVSWKAAASQVEQAKTTSSGYETEDAQLVAQLERITAIGEELVGNADRRVLWMEMLKAANEALPRTPGIKPGEIPDVEKVPFSQRHEIHVTRMDVQHFDDLTKWFNAAIQAKYTQQAMESGGDTAAQNATAGATATATATADTTTPVGPEGAGWAVQLDCYHYFNSDRRTQGSAHVMNTLIKNLKTGSVVFPVPVSKLQPGVVLQHQAAPGKFIPLHIVELKPSLQRNQETGADEVTGYQMRLEGVQQPIPVAAGDRLPVVFTMKEMGIDYPVLIASSRINFKYQVPNPNYVPPTTTGSGAGGMLGGEGMGAMMGAGALDGTGAMTSGIGDAAGRAGKDASTDNEPKEPKFLVVPRYDFTVQFVWSEKLLTQRLEEQVKKWNETQQQQGTQPADGNLAANTIGGGA